ncbi:hypothetical protein A0H81_10103 [Grifola frondosa]|uniref:Uncharacterized protein n=1 Tax=Grifola frondosa TaxID=5627 RepID=A0A1C7LXU4_GRIFR|nr:hypothetical protein A0H81_10103 [Grifola frondosa]
MPAHDDALCAHRAGAPARAILPSHDEADTCPQICQKVEEESERRARAEEEAEQQSTSTDSPPSGSSPTARTPPPTPNPTPAPAAVAAVRDSARERRRGSISVSRFGQAADLSSDTAGHPASLPSRKSSIIVNTGAFYQAQVHNGSADSFASSHHSPTDPLDEEQVTQIEMIAGRQSLGKAVGGMLARRLSLSRSRTRSRDVLGPSAASSVFIGVSVEEATVQAEHDMEQGCDGEARQSEYSPIGEAEVVGLGATVCVGDMLRAEEGRDGKEREKRTSVGASWVEKAREFGRRLKRRSTGAAAQNPNSAA